ncbi:nucleolin-like [Belonocnema kinseyi]|uniref:nucleolin-like n=1 Tax=Belonocnema kinseyi TaxID=2817044 RepID=UPI00143DBD38|nr:nucleolin-like [Belonocnema kinseyi]
MSQGQLVKATTNRVIRPIKQFSRIIPFLNVTENVKNEAKPNVKKLNVKLTGKEQQQEFNENANSVSVRFSSKSDADNDNDDEGKEDEGDDDYNDEDKNDDSEGDFSSEYEVEARETAKYQIPGRRKEEKRMEKNYDREGDADDIDIDDIDDIVLKPEYEEWMADLITGLKRYLDGKI